MEGSKSLQTQLLSLSRRQKSGQKVKRISSSRKRDRVQSFSEYGPLAVADPREDPARETDILLPSMISSSSSGIGDLGCRERQMCVGGERSNAFSHRLGRNEDEAVNQSKRWGCVSAFIGWWPSAQPHSVSSDTAPRNVEMTCDTTALIGESLSREGQRQKTHVAHDTLSETHCSSKTDLHNGEPSNSDCGSLAVGAPSSRGVLFRARLLHYFSLRRTRLTGSPPCSWGSGLCFELFSPTVLCGQSTMSQSLMMFFVLVPFYWDVTYDFRVVCSKALFHRLFLNSFRFIDDLQLITNYSPLFEAIFGLLLHCLGLLHVFFEFFWHCQNFVLLSLWFLLNCCALQLFCTDDQPSVVHGLGLFHPCHFFPFCVLTRLEAVGSHFSREQSLSASTHRPSILFCPRSILLTTSVKSLTVPCF